MTGPELDSSPDAAPDSAPGAVPDDVVAALRAADGWPLPGRGETLVRWRRLAELAARDLVLARLAEAHADALAILAELGADAPAPGTRWGVWAAEIPGQTLTADAATSPGPDTDPDADPGDASRFSGTKAWCSGATLLTHALVTADDGLLLAVDLAQPGVRADEPAWAWPGMRGADTRTVRFAGAAATPVGRPGGYLARPGFWVGGMGVAACWYGGAVAIAAPLRARVARTGEPHAAAHLGAVEVALGAAGDVLRNAAATVDSGTGGDHARLARLARRVRSTVAQSAAEVAARVGRALGPGPYVTDAVHAQRVADLEVYIRQDHAERDLAALGLDVASGGGHPTDATWAL